MITNLLDFVVFNMYPTLAFQCWCNLTAYVREAKVLKKNSYLRHCRTVKKYYDMEKANSSLKGSFFSFRMANLTWESNKIQKLNGVLSWVQPSRHIVKNWKAVARGCLDWNNLQIHAWVNPGAQGIKIWTRYINNDRPLKSNALLCVSFGLSKYDAES